MSVEYIVPDSCNFPTSQIQKLPPGTRNVQAVITPSNNSTVTPGQNAVFTLPTSGMLDPDTLMLRFNLTCVTANNATLSPSAIIAAAGYAPWSRLEIRIGSTTVQNVVNFNVLNHAMLKMKLNLAQRAAAAPVLGIRGVNISSVGAAQTLENLNGYAMNLTAGTNVVQCCLPLMCILSQADRLIPLFALEQVEMTLYMDQLSNFVAPSTDSTPQTITSVTASNMELIYDNLSLGQDYENMVRSMPSSFYIRSTNMPSFSQALLGSGSAGSVDLSYAVRYNSIRSIFQVFQKAASTNAGFDFWDPFSEGGAPTTSAYLGGTVQWSCDNVQYPQRALDLARNRTGVRAELSQAVCSAQHTHEAYDMSITYAEWTSANTAANSTSVAVPSTVIFGTSVEKVTGISNRALNGISSKNSNINTRLVFNSAWDSATALMFLIVDVVLVIDPVTKQLMVDW